MIIFLDTQNSICEFHSNKLDFKKLTIDIPLNLSKNHDICKIVEYISSKNQEISKLDEPKNYLVISDDFIGFDCIEVPNISKNDIKNAVKVKFDILYNSEDVLFNQDIFSTDNNICYVQTKFVKKDIVKQLKESFAKINIKLNGIDFFSQYVSNNFENLKNEHNILLIQNKDYCIMSAIQNGEVFAVQTVDLKDEIYKEFVDFQEILQENNLVSITGNNKIINHNLQINNIKNKENKFDLNKRIQELSDKDKQTLLKIEQELQNSFEQIQQTHFSLSQKQISTSRELMYTSKNIINMIQKNQSLSEQDKQISIQRIKQIQAKYKDINSTKNMFKDSELIKHLNSFITFVTNTYKGFDVDEIYAIFDEEESYEIINQNLQKPVKVLNYNFNEINLFNFKKNSLFEQSMWSTLWSKLTTKI